MSRPLLSFCRSYGRWTHRTPSSVKLPLPGVAEAEGEQLRREEVVDLGSMTEKLRPSRRDKAGFKNHKYQSNVGKTPKDNNNFDFKRIDKATTFIEEPDRPEPAHAAHNTHKQPEISVLQNVFDDRNDFIYHKLPNNHKEIGKLLMDIKSKKHRNRTGLIMVEGWRLIAEGLRAGCVLQKLIFSDKDDLQKLKIFLPQTGPTIYKMSYREMSEWSNLDTCPGLIALFEKPESDKMEVSPGCLPLDLICDNVREPGNLGAILRGALGVGCRNVLLSKGCTDPWDPKVLRSAAGAQFLMPIQHGLSWGNILNACDAGTSVFIADNNAISEACNEEITINKPSFLHEGRTSKSEYRINMPVTPYFAVNYETLPSIALVVGGETEGVSEDCYRFAHDRNGTRVNIPLDAGVDSLNAGAAFAVIAFEIRRQLLKGTFSENNQILKARKNG